MFITLLSFFFPSPFTNGYKYFIHNTLVSKIKVSLKIKCKDCSQKLIYRVLPNCGENSRSYSNSGDNFIKKKMYRGC